MPIPIMRIFLFLMTFWSSSSFAADKVVLFLGDSLTAGYGVKLEESFPSVIEARLKTEGKPLQSLNGGESGALSAQMKPRLEWYLKRIKKVDLIVLIAGGNDARQLVDPKKIEAHLKETIQLAQKNKIPVVLGGMKIFSNLGASYTGQFEKIYRNLSQLPGVTLVPFVLEGVAVQKKFNQDDGFHPNAEGHKVMAETLLPYIRRSI